MMNHRRFYFGLSTTFHDPALALVNSDGEVIFAEAAERCLKYKRAYGLAADVRDIVRSIIKEYCDPTSEFIVAKPWSKGSYQTNYLLTLMGMTDHELIPTRPHRMTTYLLKKHSLFAQCWLQYSGYVLSGGNIVDVLQNDFNNKNICFINFDHHLSHAATACFTSPFEQAACMIVDGHGEGGSISYFEYKNGRFRHLRRTKGTASLGALYAVSTELCGFSTEKGEEWKVMGLAPYGKLDDEILQEFRSLVAVVDLSIKFAPLRQIRAWFDRMIPRARSKDGSPLDVADLAYTTQYFYAEIMTQLLNNFHAMGISDNLTLAGGCGLNSSYNGQILDRTKFKRLHVPSAPSDDGNALGVALLAYYRDHPDRKPKATLQSPYLGSSISKRSLTNLVRFGRISKTRHFPGTVHQETARLLAEGQLVGWVQGRAEFGPRALGNRSILADPRPPDMKDRINLLVKFREEFRPFAPSILDEFGDEYFENYQVSPYMERTLTFKESAQEKVPAIVHINRTGRLQSVRREWNKLYYELIYSFYKLTGVPMLLNTSFNIMGKPIMHSVEDAIGLFYTTGLDALVIEDYLTVK
jgi:carbamoyltransferase